MSSAFCFTHPLVAGRVRATVATLALALAGGAFTAGAQEPLVLTLGGAARLAAEKSAAPEAARLRADEAEARVRQSKAAFLPDIYGNVLEGEHTFNSASFGINFADPATGKFLFDPNGQVLGPVRTYDIRGTVAQNIYDPSAFAKLKAARAVSAAYGDEAASQSQTAAATAAMVYVRVLRADAQLAARIADSTLAEELLGASFRICERVAKNIRFWHTGPRQWRTPSARPRAVRCLLS